MRAQRHPATAGAIRVVEIKRYAFIKVGESDPGWTALGRPLLLGVLHRLLFVVKVLLLDLWVGPGDGRAAAGGHEPKREQKQRQDEQAESTHGFDDPRRTGGRDVADAITSRWERVSTLT